MLLNIANSLSIKAAVIEKQETPSTDSQVTQVRMDMLPDLTPAHRSKEAPDVVQMLQLVQKIMFVNNLPTAKSNHLVHSCPYKFDYQKYFDALVTFRTAVKESSESKLLFKQPKAHVCSINKGRINNIVAYLLEQQIISTEQSFIEIHKLYSLNDKIFILKEVINCLDLLIPINITRVKLEAGANQIIKSAIKRFQDNLHLLFNTQEDDGYKYGIVLRKKANTA